MPPAAPLPDLLIAGALTVDRFADGTSAPGGSVIHAGAMAHASGSRLATLTVCGDEPDARAGLARLERHGPVIRQPSPNSVIYRHAVAGDERVLITDALCDPLAAGVAAAAPPARVALMAPIAGELGPDALATLRRSVRPALAVFLIQGWLRELRIGQPVVPLGLDRLPAATVAAFSQADALVVSTEDMAERRNDPFGQAALLRERVGDGPLVVVTLGAEGFLLDDPGASRIVASVPRRVVSGVPTVGAGDAFGAGLALALGRGQAALPAAELAAESVIAMLEARRG